jgi:hypothetical protein
MHWLTRLASILIASAPDADRDDISNITTT